MQSREEDAAELRVKDESMYKRYTTLGPGPLPPSTPTPVPRYALGHEPEAPVYALTGGACAPHAATVAERRRAALRFSDLFQNGARAVQHAS